MSEELAGEEKQFVEEVGVVFDNTGLPRMAGRIFGWLLISDPSYQSPAEIARALKTSRGSISTMTRFLIQMDVIERIGISGDRNDYFQVKQDHWKEFLGHGFIDEIRMFRQLSEHGLEILADRERSNREFLMKIHGMYSFLEQEFPRLVESWEKNYKNGILQTG